MIQPTVTIIVPTTEGRNSTLGRVLKMAQAQDYPNVELILDGDEGSIGEKRNRLCAKAEGQVIIHFDDDDWYAKDWVSRSVANLTSGDYDVTGLHQINLYHEQKKEGWEYSYTKGLFPKTKSATYLCGATLCYWKSFWENNKFPEIQIGEDAAFVFGRSGIRVRGLHHGYIGGFLASIHEGNTSKRLLEGINYRRLSVGEEEKIQKDFLLA